MAGAILAKENILDLGEGINRKDLKPKAAKTKKARVDDNNPQRPQPDTHTKPSKPARRPPNHHDTDADAVDIEE